MRLSEQRFDELILRDQKWLQQFLKEQASCGLDEYTFNLQRFALELEWKMNEHVKLQLRMGQTGLEGILPKLLTVAQVPPNLHELFFESQLSFMKTPKFRIYFKLLKTYALER